MEAPEPPPRGRVPPPLPPRRADTIGKIDCKILPKAAGAQRLEKAANSVEEEETKRHSLQEPLCQVSRDKDLLRREPAERDGGRAKDVPNKISAGKNDGEAITKSNNKAEEQITDKASPQDVSKKIDTELEEMSSSNKDGNSENTQPKLETGALGGESLEKNAVEEKSNSEPRLKIETDGSEAKQDEPNKSKAKKVDALEKTEPKASTAEKMVDELPIIDPISPDLIKKVPSKSELMDSDDTKTGKLADSPLANLNITNSSKVSDSTSEAAHQTNDPIKDVVTPKSESEPKRHSDDKPMQDEQEMLPKSGRRHQTDKIENMEPKRLSKDVTDNSLKPEQETGKLPEDDKPTEMAAETKLIASQTAILVAAEKPSTKTEAAPGLPPMEVSSLPASNKKKPLAAASNGTLNNNNNSKVIGPLASSSRHLKDNTSAGKANKSCEVAVNGLSVSQVLDDQQEAERMFAQFIQRKRLFKRNLIIEGSCNYFFWMDKIAMVSICFKTTCLLPCLDVHVYLDIMSDSKGIRYTQYKIHELSFCFI